MNLTDQEFQELRRLIQGLCGIWLGVDKKYLIQTRLESILGRFQLGSYSALANALTSKSFPRLQDEVIEAITTKETSFNRDGHPFEEFRNKLLLDLIQNRMERQRHSGLPFGKLRIWSAASSTGQEAYSLGFAILSFIETQQRAAAHRYMVGTENFYILGTDISTEALQIARAGRYHSWELDRGADAIAKKQFFVERNGMHEVVPLLKTMVEFQRMNLTQPFSETLTFDMVLCRNLLIYFDEATRRSVLEQLVKRIMPGGLLMLGAAESTASLPLGVSQEQIGKTVVYRKMAD